MASGTLLSKIIIVLLAVINYPSFIISDEQDDGPKGYMRREYSLIKPYDGKQRR